MRSVLHLYSLLKPSSTVQDGLQACDNLSQGETTPPLLLSRLLQRVSVLLHEYKQSGLVPDS